MTDAAENRDICEMSFEDALSELETIVRGLETGKVKLDDAVSAYARGTALRRHCEEKLAAARLKIDAITISPNGEAAGLSPVAVENAHE